MMEQPVDPVAFYSDRVRQDPTDRSALSYLVLSMARMGSLDEAERYTGHLQTSLGWTNDLSMETGEELESIETYARRAQPTPSTLAPTATATATKIKRRKRKNKLPKHLQQCTPAQLAASKPDPERWIPKQLRASYLKKMKRRMNRNSSPTRRGPQGAVTTDTPALSETPAATASPNPQPASSTNTNKNNNNNKKKKKGKSRW
jgi:signal recognition particle subunit SRP72